MTQKTRSIRWRAADIPCWLVAALFALLWIGGVISYTVLGGPPPGSEAAAPGFLAIAMLLLVIAERGQRWGRLFLVGLLGFGSELTGVWYGVPFGGYHYTDHLGPALARVPLAMIAAWPVLVAYAEAVAHRRGLRGWRLALFGAAWLVAIDLMLDPLAAGELGYWVWHGAAHWFGVPLSNFLGWAIVGSVLTLLLGMRRGSDPEVLDRRPALWIGRAVVAFFVVIAFVLAVWIPGLVGLALLVADVRWLTRAEETRGTTVFTGAKPAEAALPIPDSASNSEAVETSSETMS